MNADVDLLQKQESALSNREMDILQGLVDRLDYKADADKLFISSLTVRAHLANIYKNYTIVVKPKQ